MTLGLDLVQDLADVLVLLSLDVGAEADGLLVQPPLDDLLQPVEGTAADEENILRVHLDELLVGMLPAALGRHVGNGPLHDLQQSLLDTLARYVPGDGGVLALTGDLVDLIHIDDAVLRQLHIVVRCLEETQENILHIVANIARLSEGGGVGNSKRNLENPGQGLGLSLIHI